MLKTSVAILSFATMLLIATTFGATTLVNAQAPAAPQSEAAEAPDPSELRGVEVEETFSDDQRAMQADEEDNDPANAQRLMILDSRGRPYMYDGVRDGIVCRARRVFVRRDAFGGGVYRKTVRCNSR